MILREFRINNCITLRLIQERSDSTPKTVIFFNNSEFRHCKRLLLNIPEDEISNYGNIDSIDDILLDQYLKKKSSPKVEISPEEEFWAHCSNLQAWVEHDYDTRLLDSTLSFPLLKKLYEARDPVASKIFKEEIAKRFLNDNPFMATYLIKESFLDVLSNAEFWQLISTDLIDEDEKFALWEIFKISLRRFYPRHKISSKYLNIPYFEIEDGRVVRLYLGDCGLRSLPESIGSFKCLKELDLSLNNVSELPISVGKLNSLEILNIQFNPIDKLPDSVRNLKKLKEVIETEVITKELLEKINKIKKELSSNKREFSNLK